MSTTRGSRNTIETVSGDIVLAAAASRRGAGLDAELDKFVPTEAASAFLIVTEGGQVGRVHPVAKGTVFVGRADDADIIIPHATVSGRHARIISIGSGFEIEDLNSSNGTFIGADRIVRARLKSGDRLRIGEVAAAFVMSGRQHDQTVPMVMDGGAYPPAPLPPVGLPRLNARPEEDDQPSLKQAIARALRAYRYLRRNAILIGSLACLGVALGAASAILLPPGASAFCEMKLMPEGKANPIETERNGESIRFFAAAERTFVNQDLIGASLEKLGVAAPSQSYLEQVGKRLSIEATGDNVFMGTFRDTALRGVGLDALAFLRTHVTNYLESEVERTLKVVRSERNFLREQLQTVKADLARIGKERVVFQESNAVQLFDGQSGAGTASVMGLETRRGELTGQMLRLQGEVESARQQLAFENPVLQGRVQANQAYRDALGTVTRKLEEARARGLGDAHPEVRQLTEEQRRLQQLMTESIQAQPTSVEKRSSVAEQTLQVNKASMEAQLRAARSELGEIDSTLRKARRVAVDLPRIDARLQDLTRQHQASQSLHDQLLDKLNKTELQLELERVSVSSRYELTIPPRLEQSRRLKTWTPRVALGLLAGLFIAALVLGVREARRLVAEVSREQNQARA